MPKLSAWVNAARPRTLPLSISGIVVGTALANFYGQYDHIIFCLSLLTTIGFQITSNFANDYGDGVKGTDNDDRVGPKRALQRGLLTPRTLKKGVIVSVFIDVILICSLLFVAFGKEHIVYALLFLFLGGFSIWAAIKYTMGKSPYGYSGLGDFFVFIFFGLVGVLGSMFLYVKAIPIFSVLPAISIGLLSVGVLNLNNLRDHRSDKTAGKNTIIVKIGFDTGKKYHYALLIVSFLCLLGFILLTQKGWVYYISLLAYIPILVHSNKVQKTINPAFLDSELKKLALSAFLLALLFYFGYNNFL